MKYIYIIFSCMFISNITTAQNKDVIVIDSLFTLSKTDLSSENTEFGAILTNDNTVYFTRANNNLKAEDKNESDLDIYQAVLNTDNSLTDTKPLTSINSKWHDGPVTITSDGNTMYFASESFNLKKGFEKEKTSSKILKKGKIYLYKASKIDNEWTNITSLPFNQVNYSTRNPSISEDGKILYFSSNMPGGFGGEDIWKVTIDKNLYSTPENLGGKINTSSHESFPFITSKNILYFSSNTENGFGGLDVYKTDLNKKPKIINVGMPINSEKDDFAFSLNDAKKTGFVSSNREDSDNIYIINPICRLYANITVSDKETGALIIDAKVDVLDSETINQSLISLHEPVLIKLECDKKHQLAAAKEGYENANQTIASSTEGGELTINIQLIPIKPPVITETEVVLQTIHFEFNKSNITNKGTIELDKLVLIMTNNPEMVILVKSHTDNRGTDNYNIDLSNKRAKATVDYIISKGIPEFRISGKGFGETNLKIKCENCTDEENSKNRRSEFMIIKK